MDRKGLAGDGSWLDPLNDRASQSEEAIMDEVRFSDERLLYQAQARFWHLVYPYVSDRNPNHFGFVYQDGHCGYLFDGLRWFLEQDDENKRYGHFRRINNNFSTFSRTELEIRPIQSMFYQLYLKKFPKDREKIISIMFEVNLFLAKWLEQSTRPNILQKAAGLITGTPTVLIAYDPEKGQSVLKIEDKSAQLRLTGPEDSIAKVQEKKAQDAATEEYDKIIGSLIDSLVKGQFDIAELLEQADKEGKLAETLGQIFLAISAMLKSSKPKFANSGSAQISQALKYFRKPERLANKALNIFGNVLITCIEDGAENNLDLKPMIVKGITELCRKNNKLFADFGWEFFNIVEDEAKPGGGLPKQQLRQSDPAENIGAISDKAPVPATADNLEALVDGLGPIERLSVIYRSGKVNAQKLRNYDPYAREILSLILCGKIASQPAELDRGYKEWQKLVHTDKNPDATLAKFSSIISGIGVLVKKQEFIKEEAFRAISDLFDIVADMLITHSILIIPRKAERSIVIGGISVAELLKRKKYSANARVIIDGRLASTDEFESVRLVAGQVVEVIITQ